MRFGVQICRELIFPKPWHRLRDDGARIVFHLNNAIKPYDDVWEHVVIARTIEYDYVVCSVNNAAPPQELASYLVAPRGQVVARTERQVEQFVTHEIGVATAQSSPY